MVMLNLMGGVSRPDRIVNVLDDSIQLKHRGLRA